MKTLFAPLAFAIALALAGPASAQSVKSAEVPATEQTFGSIVIKSPWTRATPPGQKVGAMYMVIENKGSEAVSVVAASTPVAQTTALHTMELYNGYIRMIPVEKIEIPAGKSVELKPSSFHLMAVGLNKMLRIGKAYDVTLEFSNGQKATVKVVAWDVGTVKAE